MVAGGGGNLLTTLLEGLCGTYTAGVPRAPAPQDGAAGGRVPPLRSALRCPRGAAPAAAQPRRARWQLLGDFSFNRLTFHLQRDTCLSHLPLWWDTAET